MFNLSMPAVSVVDGAQFYIETGARWLRLRLRPFIAEVSRRTRETGRFGESVRAALEKDPALEQFFEMDSADVERTFGLRERYLFPSENAALESFRFHREGMSSLAKVPLCSAMIPHLSSLLSLAGAGRFSEAQIRGRIEEPVRPLFETLLTAGIIGRGRPKRAFAEEPGIYRLQHASLVFRSAKTGLVIDPHFHSEFERDLVKRNVQRQDVEGKIDAILLSHSHPDHYYLSALAMFPRDTPIIIPGVPRPSLLCEDMKHRLRSLGFTRVYAPRWHGEPVVVGDIEVFALPFYGEQPLLRGPSKHPDLRNWGNTYFIRTPQHTSWVLTDSGDDEQGTALEVAVRVRERFGGVDFMMSNLREFVPYSPHYVAGGGDYWLSLPTEYMQKIHELGAMNVILSVEGTAQACRASGARYYLPYAHLFGEIGLQGPDEGALIARLHQALTASGCSTEIVPWKIGEGCAMGRAGRPRRVPAPL